MPFTKPLLNLRLTAYILYTLSNTMMDDVVAEVFIGDANIKNA